MTKNSLLTLCITNKKENFAVSVVVLGAIIELNNTMKKFIYLPQTNRTLDFNYNTKKLAIRTSSRI